MFDLTPVPREVEHPDRRVAAAPRARRRSTCVAAGVRGAGAHRARRSPSARWARSLRPQTTLAAAREAAEGIGEVVWATLNPAPPTPLNVPIGPHRRFVGVRGRLADFKLVKDVFGGTVNDVVLDRRSAARCATWLRSRGVRTEGLELRALVPVSLRARARARRSSATASPRCAGRCRSTSPTRSSGCATVRAGDGRPQGVQAGARRRGARGAAELRAADDPRRRVAAELLDAAVQPHRHERAGAAVRRSTSSGARCRRSSRSRSCRASTALAIAIISYNGWLNFGLLGDYDALPDLEDARRRVEASIDELVGLRAAEGARDSAEPVDVRLTRRASARALTRRVGARRAALAVARAVDATVKNAYRRPRPDASRGTSVRASSRCSPARGRRRAPDLVARRCPRRRRRAGGVRAAPAQRDRAPADAGRRAQPRAGARRSSSAARPRRRRARRRSPSRARASSPCRPGGARSP